MPEAVAEDQHQHLPVRVARTDDPVRALETVWRMESPRLIAAFARIVRDVGLAEEVAGDTLVTALERWPVDGIPNDPAAWLMTAGRRRAIDLVRRRVALDGKHQELGRQLELDRSAAEAEGAADDVGDDLLRLVLVACHPVLSMDARVALTLRLLCGLTTDEIARAFLAPEPTIAQRIVRAKRTLTEAQVPFEVPTGAALDERITAVLDVIYLVFNEGYAATSGDDWMRPGLCDEALRLVRVLSAMVPEVPEIHGLAALLEIQASRLRTRVDADGVPILLLQQDRSRWDRLLIRRGLRALARAQRSPGPLGPYTLQAAIAACHARAATPEATDWERIVALYDALLQSAPSPVVALNRAVAVSMADGPEAGLVIVEGLRSERILQGYHWLPSVRGDLLARSGRHAEAAREFRHAASLTRNARERDLLLGRATEADATARDRTIRH